MIHELKDKQQSTKTKKNYIKLCVISSVKQEKNPKDSWMQKNESHYFTLPAFEFRGLQASNVCSSHCFQSTGLVLEYEYLR